MIEKRSEGCLYMASELVICATRHDSTFFNKNAILLKLSHVRSQIARHCRFGPYSENDSHDVCSSIRSSGTIHASKAFELSLQHTERKVVEGFRKQQSHTEVWSLDVLFRKNI